MWNKTNKYRAKKTEMDGIIFDSKKEADRYSELKLLERGGQISNLEIQPKYILQESFIYKYKRQSPVTVKFDFRYREPNNELIVVEDVKSTATAKERSYRIRVRLFLKKYGKQVDFREIN